MTRYLVDTNVLLRCMDPADPDFRMVRRALYVLLDRGEMLFVAPQNLAEFWGVCTRPATSRGGLGLSVERTELRLRRIERLASVLLEPSGAYAEWRRLLIAHRIMGVQVHDARLAAIMAVSGVKHIVTFNQKDFVRYPGITALHPRDIT